MNKWIGIGRFTKDVELTYAPGTGLAITKGTIAVDRKVSKDKEKAADFIRIIAFGKTAESIAKYCGSKGDLIAIEGHIQTGNFKDKEGNIHYTFDVIVDTTQFLNTKKSNTQASSNTEYEDEMTPIDDGDTPF